MSVRLANRLDYAEIDAALSGANTVVVVPAGQRLYVVNYTFVASGAVTAEWRSAATPLSGAMSLAANGGVSAAGHPESPLFGTLADGDDLVLQLGGAVGVKGHLAYILFSGARA